MGADCPKQYMPLAGKPMLLHVLDTFARRPAIAHTFVVVSAEDGYIDDALAGAKHLADRVTVLHQGGATRHQSVLNGLTCDARRMPTTRTGCWCTMRPAPA